MMNSRCHHGQFLSDTAATLWFLFVALAFPMMWIATMGYNALFLYYACRDAAYDCAKAERYSDGCSFAYNVVRNDVTTNPGVQIISTETTIIEKRLDDGAVTGTWTTFDSPVPSAQPSVVNSESAYYIEERVRGRLATLIAIIPPYDLDVRFKVYVENPNGLVD